MLSTLWWIRLHALIPCRSGIRRRSRNENIWRNQRDNEVDYLLAIAQIVCQWRQRSNNGWSCYLI